MISKSHLDDLHVIGLYLLPRILLNVFGVLCLTAVGTLWLFAGYASVVRDKVVLSIALLTLAAFLAYYRNVLSGEVSGAMKTAASLHFDQTLTGLPVNLNLRQRKSQRLDSKTREKIVIPPVGELTKWATEEDLLRAYRHVLSFLQVVVRAQDKYTLTPPTIEVESSETRRLPHEDNPASPGQPTTSGVDIIPLAFIEKRFLRNDFSATVDDDKIDLLGSREATELSLFTVDLLWRDVFGRSHEPLKHTARKAIVADPPPLKTELADLLNQIRQASSSSGSNENENATAHLCQLIYQLATQNLIYGVAKNIKRGAFITVGQKWTIKRQVVSGGVHRPGRASELLRAHLGLAPRSFFMTMFSVARAESYHLEVVIPEGMYYYKGMAVIDGKQLPSRNASIGDRRIHHLHSNSIGTSLVHETYRVESYQDVLAQGRDHKGQSDLRETNPNAHFALHIREVPPGVGLPLGVGALATVALVAYMTHFSAGNQTAAIPAILASLPAILAGWMVSRLSGDALGRMSLASAANVVWYLINSLSAALLPSVLSEDTPPLTFDFSDFHSDSVAVGLLGVSVCANFFSILWHFILRSVRYNERLAS